jgi:methylenetetrahydrofolate dehydrogenase (NADP+)/methenyltetrahydrofolate cyclohydrolase
MAKLLLKENMNTTVLHSKTSEVDKRYYLKNADLIIVATGCPETLNSTYEFKKTAVVFDVGINVNAQGKLQGDCEKNLPVAFQSPVPGGVGLLTRVALMENVLKLLNIC